MDMELNAVLTILIPIISGILVLFGFMGVVVLLRKYMQGGQFKKDTRIDGKTVIITGANSGIGKETAIDLAKRGGKIYIACRDATRGEDALKEIKKRSESDQIFFLQLDLASLESVREFSKKFHELESHLHILINNAGVMACPKTSTKDGFELHIGTNHLGHFLLTNLLLDRLKLSAPSRVVTVSSLFHFVGKIRKDDLFGDKFYYRWFAYASSKLANILFTRQLAKKLSGTRVTANCLHPGAVHSDLQRHVNMFARVLTAPFQWIIFKDTLAGAQTQIRLAVDPELETVSGKYFADCKECWTMWTAKNDSMAEWLWRKSEELTGVIGEHETLL